MQRSALENMRRFEPSLSFQISKSLAHIYHTQSSIEKHDTKPLAATSHDVCVREAMPRYFHVFRKSIETFDQPANRSAEYRHHRDEAVHGLQHQPIKLRSPPLGFTP